MKRLTSMKRVQAERYHFEIKAIVPELILTGSLALMSQKILPERPLGDIDYMISDDLFFKVEEEFILLEVDSDEYEDTGDQYTGYFITSDKKQITFTLFVYDRSVTTIKTNLGDELIGKKIIEYKEEYGRLKDTKDFHNIKLNKEKK